jgi:MerR family redox-sensitive transcriptional activator SoxR
VDEPPSQRDWQRVAKLWRAQLDLRRTQLEHLRRELTGCIGCGCLSLKACRLLNPEDALSIDGPGPRRI